MRAYYNLNGKAKIKNKNGRRITINDTADYEKIFLPVDLNPAR